MQNITDETKNSCKYWFGSKYRQKSKIIGKLTRNFIKNYLNYGKIQTEKIAFSERKISGRL